MKLLLLSCLIVINSVRGIYREVDTKSSTLSSLVTYASYDTNSTTLPPSVEPTYEYVVAVGFDLDEAKVPEYLVNIIYDHAAEKSITTDDIVTLYGLKTIDRNTTLNFLLKLNISLEIIFSLDGLDKFLTELNVDFKEFYNRVIINKLNITGNPLRDVLQTLNIDSYNFSMGMAYGDPNPYEEFKKGTFTYETVTLALEKANRTLDDLFEACRDEFVTKALSFSPKPIVDILLKYSFGKSRALSLWNILELNMANLYSVARFRGLINELSKELNQEIYLGVLTGTNSVSINKQLYETMKRDKNISRPYAESITGNLLVQIVDEVEDELDNIIIIKTAALEPYGEANTVIEIGTTKEDLQDCKFVTLINYTIVVSDVDRAVKLDNDISISKGNVTNLILGSPLICLNKVYGLAREINGDDIVLDSFGYSGVNGMFLNSYIFSVIVGACFLQYL